MIWTFYLPEMETYRDAGEKLYHDLQRKDEQLFIVHNYCCTNCRDSKKARDAIFLSLREY